ncbi:hypothetical protein Sjap_025948 [Stephania japonica]|uniref:Uncharacterized protein n=1 Tax=Stephania japonica TaxID=461633 RepID=A0AAP0E643_9MAGN
MRTRYWQESGDRFSYSQNDGNNQLAHRPYVPSRLSHQINSRFVQAITDAHLNVSRVQEKGPISVGPAGFVLFRALIEVPMYHFRRWDSSSSPSECACVPPDEAVEGLGHRDHLTDPTWLGGGKFIFPHRHRGGGSTSSLLDPDHHHPPSLPRDGGGSPVAGQEVAASLAGRLGRKVKAKGWRESPLFLSVTVIEEYLLDLRSHAAAAAKPPPPPFFAAADLSSHAALTPANPYSLSLIAAFIAQPLMGSGGAIPPPTTYFDKIQVVVKKFDILFIADEAPSLMDLLILGILYHVLLHWKQSKYTTKFNCLITAQVETFRSSLFPPTLNGLNVFRERNIIEQVKSISPRLQDGIKALSNIPIIGEIRSTGLVVAIEFTNNKSRSDLFPPEWGKTNEENSISKEKAMQLAQAVVRYYKLSEDKSINLKGYMVGNVLTDDYNEVSSAVFCP